MLGCSFWFLKPQWLSAFVSRLLCYPIIPSDTWICPAFLLKWWRVLGGFLVQRQLCSLNTNFYPNVTKKKTKKRHKARNCMLCHLLLDLFVAVSVTQMPACFIFLHSSPKCFTWVDTQSWTRQGFLGENYMEDKSYRPLSKQISFTFKGLNIIFQLKTKHTNNKCWACLCQSCFFPYWWESCAHRRMSLVGHARTGAGHAGRVTGSPGEAPIASCVLFRAQGWVGLKGWCQKAAIKPAVKVAS